VFAIIEAATKPGFIELSDLQRGAEAHPQPLHRNYTMILHFANKAGQSIGQTL